MGCVEGVMQGGLQRGNPRLIRPVGDELPIVRPFRLGWWSPVAVTLGKKSTMNDRARVDLEAARAPAFDRHASYLKRTEGERCQGIVNEQPDQRGEMIWFPPVVIVQIGDKCPARHHLERVVPRSRPEVVGTLGEVPMSHPGIIDTGNDFIDIRAMVPNDEHLDIGI